MFHACPMVLVDGAHMDAGGILVAAGEVSSNNPTGQQSLRRNSVIRVLKVLPTEKSSFWGGGGGQEEPIPSHSSDRNTSDSFFLWINGNYLR